jgi:hypothetical protein
MTIAPSHLQDARLARAVRRLRSEFVAPGPLDVYFTPLEGPALARAEAVFFNGIRLRNGTFKTTSVARLDDVNALVAPLLPGDGRLLEVLDVGVSSAVTTAEWSEQLSAVGTRHRIVATDLTPYATLLTCGRRIAILCEAGGYPLAFQVGPMTAYLRERSGMRPRAVLSRVLRFGLSMISHLTQYLAPADPDALPRRFRLIVRPVSLVSRNVRNNRAIVIVEDDVTVPNRFPSRFDVCRAANLLNRSYFSDDTLRRMSDNLRARLRDGGLLVVCRTANRDGADVNTATVFRRVGEALCPVASLNGGSEIAPLL